MMQLKKCPFCGAAAEIKTVTRHVENNLIVAKCIRCGAATKTFPEDKPEYALSSWNTRTNIQEEDDGGIDIIHWMESMYSMLKKNGKKEAANMFSTVLDAYKAEIGAINCGTKS